MISALPNSWPTSFFRTFYLLAFCVVFASMGEAQITTQKKQFTHADTLRGSLNANRTWWNVLRYDLEVRPDFASKTISGRNTIKFAGSGGAVMQIDLQQPLVVDSIIFGNKHLSFTREDNVCLVAFEGVKQQAVNFISIYYHGKPTEAKRPPWDGGWIWTKDAKGRPWMSVACQGLGASVWYPCKDHQSDEPDEGASLTIQVPDTLTAVANGRMVSKIDLGKSSVYRWEVRNPINNYNLVPYIGYYQSFGEIYESEEGKLNCTYWVLDYNLDKAKEQFKQVKPMLACFEHWFGPYPWYEEGYQLVESPHLGMEHQSAVAYGNGFVNGYRGRDLSGSGWGNKWDFIIIHESGHEWFGNSITTNDIADMWVHEGFTNYSETLFTECQYGKKAGDEYLQGVRQGIRNDRPIIGPYGVNEEGSGDMYPKGANLLHTIRTIINNDSLFRQILLGLNKTYFRKTTSSREVEQFISAKAGYDFSRIFDQYLRTTQVPIVEWKLSNGSLQARLANCLPDLTMPVWLPTAPGNGKWTTLSKNNWQQVPCALNETNAELELNKNLYVEYKVVNP
jgi:aminopeptidase N